MAISNAILLKSLKKNKNITFNGLIITLLSPKHVISKQEMGGNSSHQREGIFFLLCPNS